jgi:hypothetical protein
MSLGDQFEIASFESQRRAASKPCDLLEAFASQHILFVGKGFVGTPVKCDRVG